MQDVDEVEACLRARYPELVRAVAPAAADAADAEDAVQEAFARAWEREARGRCPDDVAAWVVTVALNQLRSGWRRRATARRFAPRLVPVAPDGTEVHGAAEHAELRTAVRTLPRRQQEAVVLHHLLGHTVAEVAAVLDVSESTVKSALVRGRAALAEALGGGDDG